MSFYKNTQRVFWDIPNTPIHTLSKAWTEIHMNSRGHLTFVDIESSDVGEGKGRGNDDKTE